VAALGGVGVDIGVAVVVVDRGVEVVEGGREVAAASTVVVVVMK
jgi:hypothetical protein